MDPRLIALITFFVINMISYTVYISYRLYRKVRSNRRRQEWEQQQQLYEQQQEQEEEEGVEVTVNLEVVINIQLQPEEERRMKEIAASCTECAVCLGDYESDQNGVAWSTLKPCCHKFHKVCIDTWLKNAHRCPTCRAVSYGVFSVSVHGATSADDVQGLC